MNCALEHLAESYVKPYIFDIEKISLKETNKLKKVAKTWKVEFMVVSLRFI